MYGLIGGNLSHSYSKMIHRSLSNIRYELISLSEDQFNKFMIKKFFKGINVTIPYKQKVIPFLDEIDDKAKRIGAVNTVINHDGYLKGYNTDYDGFKYLLTINKINIKNKKCVILGTGGTSKTVKCVLEDLGASSIIKLSRNNTSEGLNYKDVNEGIEANVIINTTPVGMYPNINQSAIDLNKFNNVEAVVDVIYNPFRTKLILDAIKLDIKAVGGLEMLIYQAKVANEIFLNRKYSDEVVDNIYKKIMLRKRNIVLIGLPGSGKTTIGKYLARRIKKPIIDIDKIISKNEDKNIHEIFNNFGEKYFRNLENEIIKQISLKSGLIISTGGGVVKNQENMDLLRANGFVIFLNRDIDKIILREGKRPLIKSNNDLIKIKEERYKLYSVNADIVIKNNFTIEKAVRILKSKILKSI